MRETSRGGGNHLKPPHAGKEENNRLSDCAERGYNEPVRKGNVQEKKGNSDSERRTKDSGNGGSTA